MEIGVSGGALETGLRPSDSADVELEEAGAVSVVTERPRAPLLVAALATKAPVDALAVLLAAAITAFARTGTASFVLHALVVWLPTGVVFGAYSQRHSLSRSVIVELPALARTSICTAGLLSLFWSSYSVYAAALFALQAVAYVALLRATSQLVGRKLVAAERLVVAGTVDFSQRFARKVELKRLHVEIAATLQFDDVIPEAGPFPGSLVEELEKRLDRTRASRLVLCSEGLSGTALRSVTSLAQRRNVRLSLFPTIRGAFGHGTRLNQVAELPVLDLVPRVGSTGATLRAKRAMDVVGASVGLLLFFPLMCAIAIVIVASDRGPVFFRQERAGLLGKPFMMLKFRTMTPDAERRLEALVDFNELEQPMYKFPADPRTTRIGAVLRRTSLDELPQLINVLRGEMSLVGPRPEDIRLVKNYDSEALQIRCGMRPGLTGPMQVHGRGDLSFVERLDVEREYAENHSLSLDLRILAQTFSAVVPRRGAY